MRRVSKWCKALCGALLLALTLTACTKQDAKIKPQGKAYFTYFDTVSYVYSYAGDSAETFEAHSAEAAAVLKRYHQLFDIYHEYEDVVNLCTINRQAGGQALQVDQELIDFLLYAKEMYAKTGGRMNVMMGSVLRLWHDCREAATEDPKSAHLPDEQALQEAARHISIDALEIDPQQRTVRISDKEASLDVGALGKGYATEKAAQALEQQGVTAYVLNVGGNIRILGTKPDGSSWVTGIRDPNGAENEFIINLNLSDTSCSTSGVYERYFVVDGKRYHHIIDQDTLYPAGYFASLSVITPDSGYADALSTALFCMSYEQGMQLAQALGDVEVLWVMNDGEVRYTPGLEKYIKKS